MLRHRRSVNLEEALCQIHSDYRIFISPSSPPMPDSTTILAHRDAVWGGRQPSHLLSPAVGLYRGHQTSVVPKRLPLACAVMSRGADFDGRSCKAAAV